VNFPLRDARAHRHYAGAYRREARSSASSNFVGRKAGAVSNIAESVEYLIGPLFEGGKGDGAETFTDLTLYRGCDISSSSSICHPTGEVARRCESFRR